MMNSRRVVLLGLVAALLIAGMAAPVLAKSGHLKATGEIWAVANVGDIYLVFNAHGTDPAKGQVFYSRPNLWFDGIVTCYHQAGNEAVFGGEITAGNTSQGYFLVGVQDNGEGKKATAPDRIAGDVFGVEQPCALFGGYSGVAYAGNLQVH